MPTDVPIFILMVAEWVFLKLLGVATPPYKWYFDLSIDTWLFRARIESNNFLGSKLAARNWFPQSVWTIWHKLLTLSDSRIHALRTWSAVHRMLHRLSDSWPICIQMLLNILEAWTNSIAGWIDRGATTKIKGNKTSILGNRKLKLLLAPHFGSVHNIPPKARWSSS